MVVPLHTVVSGPSENSDKDIIGCVVSRTKEMSSRTGDGKLLLNCALNGHSRLDWTCISLCPVHKPIG